MPHPGRPLWGYPTGSRRRRHTPHEYDGSPISSGGSSRDKTLLMSPRKRIPRRQLVSDILDEDDISTDCGTSGDDYAIEAVDDSCDTDPIESNSDPIESNADPIESNAEPIESNADPESIFNSGSVEPIKSDDDVEQICEQHSHCNTAKQPTLIVVEIMIIIGLVVGSALFMRYYA
jgi:hypothetical protein